VSIELITGSPGAGKTTFAVATRVLAESERFIELPDKTKIKRRIVAAGVRGLVIEHERLPHALTGDKTNQREVDKWNEVTDSGDTVHERLPGMPPVKCDAMVQNWWLWCLPGDCIVVDEVQFLAERGIMGRKPPYWIRALEIHRHYGVDFIFITQHPGLVDSVIKALVNPHRHVRSVMGSALCTVYTWDHASNTERLQHASKSAFLRRAKHYRLFHSTVAVVAPPTAGRWVLIGVPALFLAAYLGLLSFKQRFEPAPVPLASAVASPLPGGTVPLSHPDGVAPRVRTGWRSKHPFVAGCVASGDVCRCVGDKGAPVQLDLASCKTASSSFDGLVEWEPREAPFANGAPSYGASAPSSSAPVASLGL
jgi:Zonular occludens toxin (Zot)